MVARRDAGDVGGVLGVHRVERQRRVLPDGARRGERARDDHLRRREARIAFREARRIGEAARVEEDVRPVEPVVDDPDLDSVPGGGERRPPDLGRADQLRRPVEERVVGDARPDGRARQGAETAEL